MESREHWAHIMVQCMHCILLQSNPMTWKIGDFNQLATEERLFLTFRRDRLMLREIQGRREALALA